MRENQNTYNLLLRGFGGESKSFRVCEQHLITLGYTYEQAKNAVHGFRTGSETTAIIRRSKYEWDGILDRFGLEHAPKEMITHLREKYEATYRQARSAVYQYRKSRGLVGR